MKKIKFYFFYSLYVCVCVPVCAMLAGTHGNHKVSGDLKLELEGIVNYLIRLLEWSSGPEVEQQVLLTTGHLTRLSL